MEITEAIAMKTKSLFTLVLACFIGVLAALQLDRIWHEPNRGPLLSEPQPLLNSLQTVGDPQPAGLPDFRVAAKKVTPSVVSVDNFQRVSRGFFDDEGTVAEAGTGSGVIVSADGVIVTNNHVVQGAEQVRVRLNGNRAFSAKVLGSDPRSDLAVIKIDAKGLSAVELGDSSTLEVGQWVMAVGNPLGFDNTVSVGVVSSMNRSLPVERGLLVNAIQTDAAINPGNSGGALTDAVGRLIGINSAIASGTGQSVGIGFAIPVNRVRAVVNDIIRLGYVRYGGLGVEFNPRFDGYLAEQDVRSQLGELTQSANIPTSGVIVKAPGQGQDSVVPGGSAERAGVKEWDVILEIDGQAVEKTLDVTRILTPKKPGDSVSLKLWSRGKIRTVSLKLMEIRGS